MKEEVKVNDIINHLNKLPQGKAEHHQRVKEMTWQMHEERFGSCTSTRACEVECPEGISITYIAEMNARFIKSKISG